MYFLNYCVSLYGFKLYYALEYDEKHIKKDISQIEQLLLAQQVSIYD